MKTENRAEEQAKLQCESIVEMVAALDKTTAAKAFADTLTESQCRMILHNGGSEASDLPDVGEIEELREMVADGLADDTLEAEGFEFDDEAARETIQEDPLSLEFRSGWVTNRDDMQPEEFCLLLCTGGPAVRIIGDIDRGEATNPRVQYQDWGTPWTEYFPSPEQREALETYCQQFYMGE